MKQGILSGNVGLSASEERWSHLASGLPRDAGQELGVGPHGLDMKMWRCLGYRKKWTWVRVGQSGLKIGLDWGPKNKSQNK